VIFFYKLYIFIWMPLCSVSFRQKALALILLDSSYNMCAFCSMGIFKILQKVIIKKI